MSIYPKQIKKKQQQLFNYYYYSIALKAAGFFQMSVKKKKKSGQNLTAWKKKAAELAVCDKPWGTEHILSSLVVSDKKRFEK